jgi:hypothetical protein
LARSTLKPGAGDSWHTIELEMHDQTGPLKLLGQHDGLFTEAPRERTLGKDLCGNPQSGWPACA